MNTRSERKLELETELHGAIERAEMSLHYQPILDCGDEPKVVGVEALLRWRHPELGHVEPEEFIPIAEEAGLMTKIGEWTLDTACREVANWHRVGLPPIRLAVNISSCQLKQERFAERVAAILRDSALEPERLEVELTEREVMANDPTSIRCLVELKELGVGVGVDDFGTGHSALVYLKKFPLDVVKIDRSFVRGINSDSSDSAIISAVIAMAHCLQLRVVAEGVETAEQLAFLRAQSCDEIQGFFFSRPLDAPSARRWVENADAATEPAAVAAARSNDA